MFPRRPKRVVRQAEGGDDIVDVAVRVVVGSALDAALDAALDTVGDTVEGVEGGVEGTLEGGAEGTLEDGVEDTLEVDVECTLGGAAVAAGAAADNTQSHCLPAKVDGRDSVRTSMSTYEKAPGCGREKTHDQSESIGQSSWDE